MKKLSKIFLLYILLAILIPVSAYAAPVKVDWQASDMGTFSLWIRRPQKDMSYMQGGKVPLILRLSGEEIQNPKMYACLAHHGVPYESLKSSKTKVFPNTSFYKEGDDIRADLDISYVYPGKYTIWVMYKNTDNNDIAHASVDIEITVPSVKSGWDNSGEHRYYFSNGKMIQNKWMKIGIFWYGVDVTGIIPQNEWLYADGYWYYNDENYRRSFYWRNIENQPYFFGRDGKMYTGLQEIEGKTYYFDESGVQQKNVELEIDGKKYKFGEEGAAIQ